MKTAVTIIYTKQVGMDEWKDIRLTKVFEDSATLLEIKEWIHSIYKSKIDVSEISIGTANISDVL